MERVGSNDHPLSSAFNTTTPTGRTRPSFLSSLSANGNRNRTSYTGSTSTARTPSASLLQSAVRSVLDDATPTSTIVSDDRSEGESFVDGDLVTPHKYHSKGQGRRRQQKKQSPTLESLQMQQLPPIPDQHDRKRFIGCLAAVLAAAYDYDVPDNEEGVSDAASSKGSFAYLDYTEESEDEAENDDDGSFCYPRTSLSGSSFDESSFSIKGHTDDVSSRAKKRNSTQKTSNGGAASLRGSNWGVKAKAKEELAKHRTRRRRYNVGCELLVASSELLLLDKSVARGFLPMLSRILAPRSEAKKQPQHPKSIQHRNGLPPRTSQMKSSVSATTKGQTRSAPNSPADRIPAALKTNASFVVEEYNTVEMRNEPIPLEERETIKDYETEGLDRDEVLQPFLESMTPGSGFRCLSLLLLQHLLTSKVGYDARIRHVLKKLGVLVLVHDMGNDPVEQELLYGTSDNGNSRTYKELLTLATRKFEALEASIARRIIRLSKTAPDKRTKDDGSVLGKTRAKDEGLTREKILRGVKIGSAGIVAGTLFALTGGLAAPGIAAGVAALAGSTAAATAAVVTLTSTAVVTTIFGVGGGSLAAYKMQRRTQGLTEFEFQKEFTSRPNANHSNDNEHTLGKTEVEAELSTTICISGWLRDRYDYQRPWGLHPTRPRLLDRLELLERFYSVFRPDYLPNCSKILSSWKGEERKLWIILEEKYGRDPDHLFPLPDGPRLKGTLTLDQEEALDAMFVELGYNSVAPSKEGMRKAQRTPFERMREGWKDHQRQKMHVNNNGTATAFDSMHGPLSGNQNVGGALVASADQSYEEAEYHPPKHLATVWDYRATYGGELYTVRWESTLLTTICDCVMDLAMDVVSGATRQILKATVLSTLLAAVVLPSYLLNVANMIDGDWTLAVERADEAGKELARILLFSRAGQRPVTLVGFSFGARIIYSCLKELARLQEEWEDFEELKNRDDKLSNTEQHNYAKLAQKFNGMREPSSVVEDAIIMGLPNHLSLPSWKACRQVVAGRLVNCFSTKDLILSLMFQAKRFSPGVQSILKPVCGTCEVNETGVENIDVSDLVQGHQDYCLLTGKILERVKFGEPLRQKRSN